MRLELHADRVRGKRTRAPLAVHSHSAPAAGRTYFARIARVVFYNGRDWPATRIMRGDIAGHIVIVIYGVVVKVGVVRLGNVVLMVVMMVVMVISGVRVDFLYRLGELVSILT